MKCQGLFSWKKKFNLLSAELAKSDLPLEREIKLSVLSALSLRCKIFLTHQSLTELRQIHNQKPVNMAFRRLYIHRSFGRNTTHPLILMYILQSISKTYARIYITKGFEVIMITRFLLPNTVRGDN